MKICRLLTGFIIKVKYFFFLNAMFIYYYKKMEFIYKNVKLHLSGK